MFGYYSNPPIKTNWHFKVSICVLQEMFKKQQKKPVGILDAPCVGITKSANKNHLVFEGFHMVTARNAQKPTSIPITPCGYCNVFSKEPMFIVGSYGGIAMLAKKTSIYSCFICRFCNIYSKN
jgi:hypothetical protein